MRTPSASSVFYAPANVPDGADQFRRYIDEELRKVAAAISLLASGHLDKTTAAPAKPREGDIRLADGVGWNPGSGTGIYAYYNGAWHILG